VIMGSGGVMVGVTIRAIGVTRTQVRTATVETVAKDGVATIAIEASAVKAVSAAMAPEQKVVVTVAVTAAVTVAAEVVATEVVRVIARPNVSIARAPAATDVTSRTLAPSRVRVAIRTPGPTRAAGSTKPRDLIREPRVGARIRVPA